MAKASVEIYSVNHMSGSSDPIYGICIAQQELTAPATLSVAVTQAQFDAGARVARVCAIDAALYVAVGSAPDATATAKTAATSAKKFIAQGADLAVAVMVGDKISIAAA